MKTSGCGATGVLGALSSILEVLCVYYKTSGTVLLSVDSLLLVRVVSWLVVPLSTFHVFIIDDSWSHSGSNALIEVLSLVLQSLVAIRACVWCYWCGLMLLMVFPWPSMATAGPPLSSFVLTVAKSDEVDKDDFTNSELI